MKTQKANITYKNPLSPLQATDIEYIFLHHIEAESATPETIHAWHLANGWNGGGYSDYARKDGNIYIMRGLNEQAHCPGYNRNSYSIACEGNYQVEKDMPSAQYTAVVNRIKELKPTFPNLKAIVGHREKYNTACPGQYFPLDKIKLAVSTNMPVLRIGSIGEDVKYLQVQLTRLGYNCGIADGIFGQKTKAAVISFQQKKGLGVDGIVGTFTWSALNS